MSWWQYILSLLGAMVLCAVAVPAILLATYGVSYVLWRILPNGRVKDFLLKERGQYDQPPLYIPPWVKARWLKTPPKSRRIAPPAEFISAEEFKARTRDDRQ